MVLATLRCLKRDPGLSFGTFQAGCIGLYWAGYVGVKVPNERHGSLFKHQRVCDKGSSIISFTKKIIGQTLGGDGGGDKLGDDGCEDDCDDESCCYCCCCRRCQ